MNDLSLQMINLTLVFNPSRDAEFSVWMCWTQAASGEAGWANDGLCPASGYYWLNINTAFK